MAARERHAWKRAKVCSIQRGNPPMTRRVCNPLPNDNSVVQLSGKTLGNIVEKVSQPA